MANKTYAAVPINEDFKVDPTMVETEETEATENEEFMEEDTMNEEKKHPIKDWFGRNKKKILVGALGVLAFGSGIVVGAASSSKSDNSQASNDSSDCPDLIEVKEDNDSVDGTAATVDSDATTVE